jgi:hypothetical protein
MILSIPAILNLINNEPDINKQFLLLRKYNTPALRNIIVYGISDLFTFDVVVPSHVKSILPEGIADLSLYSESRTLYLFMSNTRHISPKKKSDLLVAKLEGLSITESQLLLDIIERRFVEKYNNITVYLVCQAMPEIAKYISHLDPNYPRTLSKVGEVTKKESDKVKDDPPEMPKVKKEKKVKVKKVKE